MVVRGRAAAVVCAKAMRRVLLRSAATPQNRRYLPILAQCIDKMVFSPYYFHTGEVSLRGFVAKLQARVAELVIGDPFDEDTDIGTIISEVQLNKVRAYIEPGRQTPGATAYECGKLPQDDRLAHGFFIRPTIFTGIDDTNPVAREEIFGPVTCMMPFDTVAEAIAIAIASDFGLAASVWTRDINTALVAVDALQAGFVQVKPSAGSRAQHLLRRLQAVRAGP
jgi:acyl-CoA reductase-like NAD-dependent aldehyde dehydrogenase